MRKDTQEVNIQVLRDENIQAIAQGDATGLRKIYREYLPRIRKLITNNGGQEADVLDVFQSAILVIYEKTRQEHFELTSSFFTLLYGICRNLWGNRLQKKSFQEVTLSEEIKYKEQETAKSIQHYLEQVEEENVFWYAFQQLGEDCQKLLRLFFDKIKMMDIAQKMGYSSISYAKKRKFQCKEKLITLVKADERYEELIA